MSICVRMSDPLELALKQEKQNLLNTHSLEHRPLVKNRLVFLHVSYFLLLRGSPLSENV